MLFRITLYTAARSTARLALRRVVQVSRSPLQRLADLISASFFVHQGSGAALRFQFRSRLLAPDGEKADVEIADGQRFGLYNLRHSLSNWLVNKAKVEPKTVQGILRQAKIQTILALYTQEDSDETRAAHGEFLTAVG